MMAPATSTTLTTTTNDDHGNTTVEKRTRNHGDSELLNRLACCEATRGRSRRRIAAIPKGGRPICLLAGKCHVLTVVDAPTRFRNITLTALIFRR